MYHRFNEKYPSTSVTEKMLREHMAFFQKENFKFLSLKELVNSLKGRIPFPERAVAITLDDAYVSAYEVAHPLFVKKGIPYTIFVNTEGIDRKFASYMSWDQLRELSRSPLVSLEAHGHTHAYMVRKMNAKEREQDIKQSVIRLTQETGKLPQFFSYPFGETNQKFIHEVRNYSWEIEGHDFQFQAAFATQSGPVGHCSHLFALPRFALNMRYGKMGTAFMHKMKARPFPVENFLPDKYVLCEKDKNRAFTLTAPDGFSLKGFQCFATNTKAQIQIDHNRAQIILDSPWKTKQFSRERINCTLPTGQGDFFWFGREFSVLNC